MHTVRPHLQPRWFRSANTVQSPRPYRHQTSFRATADGYTARSHVADQILCRVRPAQSWLRPRPDKNSPINLASPRSKYAKCGKSLRRDRCAWHQNIATARPCAYATSRSHRRACVPIRTLVAPNSAPNPKTYPAAHLLENPCRTTAARPMYRRCDGARQSADRL